MITRPNHTLAVSICTRWGTPLAVCINTRSWKTSTRWLHLGLHRPIHLQKDRYGKEYLAYGGDFGDRPSDYSFCGNGIVHADRQVTAKMQEVKFLYQNIKLFPSRDGVKIVNQNLFADTSAFELVYSLERRT